ncbi:MAG: hypothetical protein DRI80_08360 [Chloroflexota bacterium]|nr:MAG: hypothetical protein DRI80_08360 [Chloroflexota bacterium]
MESTARDVTYVARLSGNLSLLAAIFACLMLWGGIVLLLTHPSHPHASAPPADEPVLPRPVARWEGVSQARRWLADLLLFWLPIGLSAVACGAGVAALACGRGRDAEASRRALIGLFLSIVPGCLCALWVLAFTVSPLLGR